MGQYFFIANTTKKEFLHPHKFDEGLKLLEFGYSRQMMLALTVLLRKSSETGGGDFPFDNNRKKKVKNASVGDLAEIISETLNTEGNTPDIIPELVGHWANDNIVIIGDYDKSNLFDEIEENYKDISEQIITLLKDYDIYDF